MGGDLTSEVGGAGLTHHSNTVNKASWLWTDLRICILVTDGRRNSIRVPIRNTDRPRLDFLDEGRPC